MPGIPGQQVNEPVDGSLKKGVERKRKRRKKEEDTKRRRKTH